MKQSAIRTSKHGTVGLLSVLAALCLAGCGEPLTAYRAAGHDPATAKKVLVLPFLDARSFRDPKDPLNKTVGTETRDIFAAALKRNAAFKDKEIMTPAIERPADSLTTEQALEYGFRQNADLVVAGQIFSYNETRAASIPPRAGMFIRIFSVPEDKLVFVGDHYQSAGGPGASGGRKRQAELVCDTILKGYLTSKKETESAYDPGSIIIRAAKDNTPKVLVLPYHERKNPNNLIEKTGGGAVVSSLFMMEMGKHGAFQIITPSSARVNAQTILTPEEALALARELGADFVVRGEVVEFRRAMSVPSWYSVLISTAILAAQVLFAESSGVDIATEAWRVEDGKCIFTKRNIRKQKYVVQAERTVRRAAAITIPELITAIKQTPKTLPEPIIDSIVVPDPPRPTAADEEAIAEKTEGEKTATPETPVAKTDEAPTAPVTDKAETTAEKKDEVAKPEADSKETPKAEEDAKPTTTPDAPAPDAEAQPADTAPQKETENETPAETEAAKPKTSEKEAVPSDETDKPAVKETKPAASPTAEKTPAKAAPETPKTEAAPAENKNNSTNTSKQKTDETKKTEPTATTPGNAAGKNPFKESLEGTDY